MEGCCARRRTGCIAPPATFSSTRGTRSKRALITHAHGDHARPGSAAYLCTEGTGALLRRRFGAEAARRDPAYGTPLTIGDVRVSFHPAGHVLGSAQIRLEGAGGIWVVSGDYKRAADPTCAPFEPVRCDTFVTESTFGLPIYRWDSTASVISDVHRLVAGERRRAGARRCCSATRSARRSACSPSSRR